MEIINQYVKDRFWFSEFSWGEKQPINTKVTRPEEESRGRRKGWRKEITVKAQESCEAMLSHLALVKKASDTEILEFMPLTACGIRKIITLISTSTVCTEG